MAHLNRMTRRAQLGALAVLLATMAMIASPAVPAAFAADLTITLGHDASDMIVYGSAFLPSSWVWVYVEDGVTGHVLVSTSAHVNSGTITLCVPFDGCFTFDATGTFSVTTGLPLCTKDGYDIYVYDYSTQAWTSFHQAACGLV